MGECYVTAEPCPIPPGTEVGIKTLQVKFILKLSVDLGTFQYTDTTEKHGLELLSTCNTQNLWNFDAAGRFRIQHYKETQQHDYLISLLLRRYYVFTHLCSVADLNSVVCKVYEHVDVWVYLHVHLCVCFSPSLSPASLFLHHPYMLVWLVVMPPGVCIYRNIHA